MMVVRTTMMCGKKIQNYFISLFLSILFYNLKQKSFFKIIKNNKSTHNTVGKL